MGLRAWLTNRGRAAPVNPALRYGLQATGVPAALQLQPESALDLASCWAAVRLISQAVACSDAKVYAVDPDGVRRDVRDPGADLLNWNPNPEQLPAQVKEWIVRDMLVQGCGYAECVRTGGGRVAEVWPLYAERVRPRRTDAWTLVYDYTDDRGELVTFAADQLLIVPYGRPGESVLRRAMRALALASAEQGFALQHFAGGIHPSAVISVPAKLTPRQRAEYVASINAQHQGPDKGSQALLLDGGATLEELELANLQTSSLLESRTFSLQEIARCFGIHPALLGDAVTSQGYGSNVVAFLNHTYRAGLLPVAVALGEALTRSLYRPRSALFMEIDLGWYLDGGRQATASADAQDTASKVLTINEARAARGLAAVPWGNGPEEVGTDGEVVQDTAMNGAQVQALQAIVQAVAAGQLPAESARAMILAAFPAVPPATVDAMLAGLEDFEITTEEPAAPAAPGAPPPAAAEEPPPAMHPAGGEPQEPGEPVPSEAARVAAQALAASALGRHWARVAARRADLRQAEKSDEEIAANLAELDQRAVEELAHVLALAGRPEDGIRAAVSAVSAGVEPSKVATHLLGGG